MATRTIIATKSSDNANIVISGSMKFSVYSDTGPVTGASVASARMSLSNATPRGTANMWLQVKYGTYDGDVLAETSALSSNIAGLALPLHSLRDALLTDNVSTICLTLQGDSGAGEMLVADGCTIILEITYSGRCGMPGNVRLSASHSSGGALLQWNAAADGDGNAVSYYEVARQTSTDGGNAWTGWDSVGTTTGLYKWVDAPATEGHMYRFRVRAVGTAGEDYASYWVQSGTLTKVRPALISYTDPVITAGVTNVKAAHITELQTNVNIVRSAYNMAAYNFTTITPQYTSLGGWNAHIAELRSAIDGAFPLHEAWLPLGDNCPRADVLEQLRRVVEAVADD